MQSLMKMIMKIPAEISDYVINYYIQQCKLKSALAFIQWRIKFNHIRSAMKDNPYDSSNQELTESFENIRSLHTPCYD